MTRPKFSSQAVGQVADLLSITVPVVSLVLFGLAAFGLNPFTEEQTAAVFITMVAFGVTGIVAVGTAFVLSGRDGVAFSDTLQAGVRTLYRVGLVLLFLAVASGLLLFVHPAPVSCPPGH
ncbi:hypothetical protein [Kutzneria chonburiensis]|uniref:Uncharacterized protein n=1 Tax=Kutzneria chonburiensis TaxID=1483604 RepID=A0ABV6MRI3_9PSEU|nr:hypothetical protein [Kutzneria chonburiensis]